MGLFSFYIALCVKLDWRTIWIRRLFLKIYGIISKSIQPILDLFVYTHLSAFFMLNSNMAIDIWISFFFLKKNDKNCDVVCSQPGRERVIILCNIGILVVIRAWGNAGYWWMYLALIWITVASFLLLRNWNQELNRSEHVWLSAW